MIDGNGGNGKKNGGAACSVALWMLILKQLSIVALASEEPSELAMSFTCFELEEGVLDERIFNAATTCKSLTENKNKFIATHVAQHFNVNGKLERYENCRNMKNLRYKLQYSTFNFDGKNHSMIPLRRFIEIICDKMKKIPKCIGKIKPLQRINTFKLSQKDGSDCSIIINITKDYACSNYIGIGHVGVCTADRKHSINKYRFSSCGSERIKSNIKYTLKTEVLYHNAGGQLMRQSFSTNIKRLVNLSLEIDENELCDLMLFDALKLVPKYREDLFRFAVLHRYLLSSGSNTVEVLMIARRVHRKQHELQVVNCKKPTVGIFQFYYRNFSLLTKYSVYFNLSSHLQKNDDYYSFVPNQTEVLNNLTYKFNEFINISGKYVVVGKDDWMRRMCNNLREALSKYWIKENTSEIAMDNVGLALFFSVRTINEEIVRLWSMHILLIYDCGIFPHQHEIFCEQPSESKPAVSVRITQDYYLEHVNKTHCFRDVDSSNKTWEVNGKGSRGRSAKECENANITFVMESKIRLNGPHYLFSAVIRYDWDTLCNQFLQSKKHLNYTTYKMYRLEAKSSTVLLRPTFHIRLKAFKQSRNRKVVDCDERFESSHWRDRNDERERTLVLSGHCEKFFICENTFGRNVCKNITWELDYCPMLPAPSVNLTKTVQQLCLALEHYPVYSLISKEKYKNNNISVKLTYNARLLCGVTQSCQEESVEVELTLNKKNHDPWVYLVSNCSVKFVEFDFNEVFGSPNSTEKFFFNFLADQSRICMFLDNLLARLTPLFSWYFLDACNNSLKVVEQLPYTFSVNGTKVLVSLDMQPVCKTMLNVLSQTGRPHLLAFFKIALRRNKCENAAKVLLLAVKIATSMIGSNSLKEQEQSDKSLANDYYSHTFEEVSQGNEISQPRKFIETLVLYQPDSVEQGAENEQKPDSEMTLVGMFSVFAIALVAFLVLVVPMHYAFSTLVWNTQRDIETTTVSGQQLYSTRLSYATSPCPQLFSEDVTAVVDSLDTSCYFYEPRQTTVDVVNLNSQSFESSSHKSNVQMNLGRRHVSFTLGESNRQLLPDEVLPQVPEQVDEFESEKLKNTNLEFPGDDLEFLTIPEFANEQQQFEHE